MKNDQNGNVTCTNTTMLKLTELIWLHTKQQVLFIFFTCMTLNFETNVHWSFILNVTFFKSKVEKLLLKQACFMENVVTWLFSFAQHRTTPGSRPDAIEGLNAELVLNPLLKSLHRRFPRQALRNRLHPGLPKPVCSLCTYTVTHAFRISVISFLWKWL